MRGRANFTFGKKTAAGIFCIRSNDDIMLSTTQTTAVILLFLLYSCFTTTANKDIVDDAKKKNVAVATLVTTHNYVAGALVLAESLDRVNAIGDRILLYVMPTDDARSDLSKQDLQELRHAGWQTRRLSKHNGTFSECLVSEEEQALVEATPTISRYWGTCSKFAVWSLIEYDTVVYIDADSVVLNNFDFVHDMVMDAPHDGSAVFFAHGTPGYWDVPPSSTEFYGAFFAIRPSLEIQKYLHQVAQTYSAAQGELMLLNSIFQNKWKPLPRYTLVAQTEQLRPPLLDNDPIKVDWSQVMVYDFSGLPQTKPWVTYALQKEQNDKYVHPYLGRIPPKTRNFYIYMYPQWLWNDLYDAVLEKKKQREATTCNNHEEQGRARAKQENEE